MSRLRDSLDFRKSSYLSTRCANSCKLEKPSFTKGLQCRVNFFSYRVIIINAWNKLPEYVISSKSVLVLVYTQDGSLWSIVLRCDDHTGIFTCDGCARDPYFYVPAETQSYVIKLSCSRKVLAASGD